MTERGIRTDPLSALVAPLRTVSMIASGAVSAIVPLTALSVAARMLSLPLQGWLALLITAATFLGQLLGAYFVEAPLADASTRTEVGLPVLIAVVGVLGAMLSAFTSVAPGFLLVGMPICVAVLLVGRMVAVANQYVASEGVGSALLMISCVGAVLVSTTRISALTFPVLASGIAALVLSRVRRTSRTRGRPATSIVRWVVADSALTGLTWPVMSAVVLSVLGPSAVVTFRLANTLASATDPPIAYLRVRLLREHSPKETYRTLAVVGVAVIGILVAEYTHLLVNVLGPAWRGLSTVIVLAAILSRVAYLLSTPFFAAVRRAGRVGVVFALRAISTGIYVGLGAVAAILTKEVMVIFLAFMVAEVANYALFAVAGRRLGLSSVSGSRT